MRNPKEETGGTESEIREMQGFIRKHDPGYRADCYADVLKWPARSSGPDFQEIKFNLDSNSSCKLSNDRKITHEELMKMLNGRFPDE